MKSDSKSGLCMRQIIIIAASIIVITTVAQLFTIENANLQTASINEETDTTENIQGEVQVAQIKERKLDTTSRSSEERKIKEQEEKSKINVEDIVVKTEHYISIEEITISKDMDITKRCGISKEDFKTLMTNFSKDTSGFFKQNSDLIYDLCEKYEINEIFFCGLIGAESGFNIASNHRNTHNYISMMSGGKLIRYSSVEDGLEAAAKLLHNKYLTEGGSCYGGKTIAGVKTRFCPNSSTWVGLVYTCMSLIVK